MDFNPAVELLLQIDRVRKLEVFHVPALLRRPDRVDPADLGAGWGGAGSGGGHSLLLLHKANEDKEKCEKDNGDGEKDGRDKSDPSWKRERGREERSSL